MLWKIVLPVLYLLLTIRVPVQLVDSKVRDSLRIKCFRTNVQRPKNDQVSSFCHDSRILINEYVSFEGKLGEDLKVRSSCDLMGPSLRGCGLLTFRRPRGLTLGERMRSQLH